MFCTILTWISEDSNMDYYRYTCNYTLSWLWANQSLTVLTPYDYMLRREKITLIYQEHPIHFIATVILFFTYCTMRIRITLVGFQCKSFNCFVGLCSLGTSPINWPPRYNWNCLVVLCIILMHHLNKSWEPVFVHFFFKLWNDLQLKLI